MIAVLATTCGNIRASAGQTRERHARQEKDARCKTARKVWWGGRGWKKEREQRHTVILNAHRSTRSILTDLIVAIRENARGQTIVKDRVVIIHLVAAIAMAAAVAEIVLKGDVGGRVAGLHAGDVVLGPVTVLEVDALGLAGVDVGVVPVGEGGVRGHGVVGVVFVADGGEAFVVVFAAAVVEGEHLVVVVSECFFYVGVRVGKGEKRGD